MKKQALVFDLDGTLVDSIADLALALNLALAALGRRSLLSDEVKHMVGDGARVLVERALLATGGAGDTEWTLGEFLLAYEAAPDVHTRTWPGVEETLALLHEAGHRMALCTNKPERPSRTLLDSLGLDRYFPGVIGGDTLAHRKPHPSVSWAALATMDARPEQAVWIGDSAVDVASARAVGMPVIAVRYGYARGSPDDLGADAVIDAFEDLPLTLQRLAEERRP